MIPPKKIIKEKITSICILFFLASATGYAQTVQWNNTATSTAWYTASNWTPATLRTGWTTTSVAKFSGAGTRTIGINMSAGSLSMQGIYLIRSIGPVGDTITIGNSSSTPGTMSLHGAADGTIIELINAKLNLVQSTPLASGAMQLLLIQPTSKINVSHSLVNIECGITGEGRGIKIATSSGGIVELRGANTYTGLTTIEGGGGGSVATLRLKRIGDNTLPSANEVRVLPKGRLEIHTNQTLRNITVVPQGLLVVEDGAVLTITGKLTMPTNAVILNGTGKLNYTKGATLEYTSDWGSMITSSNEFPAINGPYNLIVGSVGIAPRGITLHESRSIKDFLTLSTPASYFILGNKDFTANRISYFAAPVVTNGAGKLYLTKIGTPAVEFPVSSNITSVANNNSIFIENGGGLTYGVKVETGISPALAGSSTAVNRTWQIQPSATPAGPVKISLKYAATHGSVDFNPTAPVNVLQNNTTAWIVIATGLPPIRPLPVTVSTLTTGISRFVVQNTPVMLRSGVALPHVENIVVKKEGGLKTGTVTVQSNMVSDRLLLNIFTAQKAKMSLHITDVAGRLINKLVYTAMAGNNRFEVNVANLALGVYYLSAVTDVGVVKTIRFVKG